jgi:hypothetical protein
MKRWLQTWLSTFGIHLSCPLNIAFNCQPFLCNFSNNVRKETQRSLLVRVPTYRLSFLKMWQVFSRILFRPHFRLETYKMNTTVLGLRPPGVILETGCI